MRFCSASVFSSFHISGFSKKKVFLICVKGLKGKKGNYEGKIEKYKIIMKILTKVKLRDYCVILSKFL